MGHGQGKQAIGESAGRDQNRTLSRAHVLVTCRGEPADRLYSARRVYKLDGCGQKEEIVYQQVYIASDTMYVLEAREKCL